MLRPKIVIIGAGFGGTYVAKRLAPLVKRGEIGLTIVNKTNYFLFTPLLHEVATGSLSPTSVAEPLREIFVGTGVELCQGVVESIDPENRRVHVIGDGTRHTLEYDYVVIATGAETNYYNIAGAETHSLPLKTIADAARIRDKVIDSLEEAAITENEEERKSLMSFAIVGGGPTGVETTAELAEFVHDMVNRYYCKSKNCSHEMVNIHLIDAGPNILTQFSPSLRAAAKARLEKDRVHIHMNSAVSEVAARGLKLKEGEIIDASTIIWSAGVKPIVPEFIGGPPTLVGGRIAVDKHFRIINQERIFVLGDVAAYIEEIDSKPLPMLAQVATHEAKAVARNIVASIGNKKLRDFHYRSQGAMVSVGQWFAVGEIFSVNMTGRLTWWIWRTVYLFKFASWKKRIRIAFEWTFDLFFTRDVTKLT